MSNELHELSNGYIKNIPFKIGTNIVLQALQDNFDITNIFGILAAIIFGTKMFGTEIFATCYESI